MRVPYFLPRRRAVVVAGVVAKHLNIGGFECAKNTTQANLMAHKNNWFWTCRISRPNSHPPFQQCICFCGLHYSIELESKRKLARGWPFPTCLRPPNNMWTKFTLSIQNSGIQIVFLRGSWMNLVWGSQKLVAARRVDASRRATIKTTCERNQCFWF